MPNKVKLKKLTFLKLNLGMCLITYLFGEDLDQRFEEEERSFHNRHNKVNFFHMCSKNKLNSILRSGSSRNIGKKCTCKAIQRAH